jgi:PHD/YefM family antitoxin component YafN of YafNO toxin-antitoxin module
LNKVLGKTDIEDALKRLDKLTYEEARMATAQILKVVHSVDDKITKVNENVKVVITSKQKFLRLSVEPILNIYMSRWKGSARGGKRSKRDNTTNRR